MTAEDLAERYRQLQGHMTGPDGLLSGDGPNATIKLKGPAGWPEDRQDIHNAIVDEIIAKNADVPRDNHAVLLGGLPGSGKTTMVSSRGELVGIDPSQGTHLHIDPDVVKDLLLAKLEALNPPQVPSATIPGIANLSPRELSGLVDREAYEVSDKVLARASSLGMNVIVDRTMRYLESTQETVNMLHGLQYRVDGFYVMAPPEQARQQALERYEKDQAAFLESGEGPGGRVVGEGSWTKTVDQTGKVVNAANFEHLASLPPEAGGFDRAVVIDNTGQARGLDGQPGQVAVIQEAGQPQPREGLPEAQIEAAERFDVQAGRQPAVQADEQQPAVQADEQEETVEAGEQKAPEAWKAELEELRAKESLGYDDYNRLQELENLLRQQQGQELPPSQPGAPSADLDSSRIPEQGPELER